jgi:hypothetical protein
MSKPFDVVGELVLYDSQYLRTVIDPEDSNSDVGVGIQGRCVIYTDTRFLRHLVPMPGDTVVVRGIVAEVRSAMGSVTAEVLVDGKRYTTETEHLIVVERPKAKRTKDTKSLRRRLDEVVCHLEPGVAEDEFMALLDEVEALERSR